MRASSNNRLLYFRALQCFWCIYCIFPIAPFFISHLSEFVNIAKLQVLYFIAFAQSLCLEMFQMCTRNISNVHWKISSGNVSNGHWKCTFNNSQHGNRGTLWDFPPLEGRSHIFAQKPSLGVLFCIYVNHLKGLRKSANLQRCLCPRHVILNAPPSLFLSSTQKPFFSALMETYFKPTILHQIGAQMVNKFMSKQFNSEIDIPAPTYKHIYTLGCTEISKTF